jgi:hypothetical protein
MPRFISTVAMKDSEPFPTFREALTDFTTRIKTLNEQNQLGLQMLETACWLVMERNNMKSAPVDFYAVRDFSHQIGMMDNKGDVLDASEPSDHALLRLFIIM